MKQAEQARRRALTRERLQRMAWLLDSSFGVPGTRFRFGLEPIIGLVPVLGDAVGFLLGAGLLYEGARAGAPRPLLLQMLGNSLIDLAGGFLPVIGDVFDFAFRANQKNADLLTAFLDEQDQTQAQTSTDSGQVLLILILVVLVLAGALYVAPRLPIGI